MALLDPLLLKFYRDDFESNYFLLGLRIIQKRYLYKNEQSHRRFCGLRKRI